MRKIIISVIATTTVLLVGTTTILASDLVNKESLKVTKTTAIPNIKQADKNTSALKSENTKTTSNNTSENNAEPEAADTNTAPTNNFSPQKTTETNPTLCEYCGNAHDHSYEDLNGDGICDHYNTQHHQNNTNRQHHRQNYTDGNNNGICDHYENGENGYWQGHHTGNNHHQGYQRNRR